MSDTLRNSIAQIDAQHPLKAPLHANVAHFSPRLDRIESKDTYLVEYIAFLEQRIAALELQMINQ